MVFPLVQPILKVKFFVTMWDTPSSNTGIGSGLATAGTAILNTAIPFLAGGFCKVEGLDAEVELENYHPGGDTASEHRFFKYAKYPKLVLKRGVTFNTDIWDWHHQVITGARKTRKSGTIIMLDRRPIAPEGEEALPTPPIQDFPVAAWTFHNALPAKLGGPMMDASSGDGKDAVAIETLELHPDKVERLSLSLIPGVADLNSAVSGLIGVAGGAALAGTSAGLGAVL